MDKSWSKSGVREDIKWIGELTFLDIGIKKEWIVKDNLSSDDIENRINKFEKENKPLKQIFVASLPYGFTISVDFIPKISEKTFPALWVRLSRGEGIDYRYIDDIEGLFVDTNDIDDKSFSGLFVIIKWYLKTYISQEGINKFNHDAYKKYLKYKDKLYTYDKNFFICKDKNNKKNIFKKKIGSKDIERIELSPIGNGILIWTRDASSPDYDTDRTISLGLYDEHGNNVWYAEKADIDVYNVGFTSIEIKGNKLFAHFTYHAYYCEIDLKTGDVLSKVFTK